MVAKTPVVHSNELKRGEVLGETDRGGLAEADRKSVV